MGKNQDPGSGINIPDPQHWAKGSRNTVYPNLSLMEAKLINLEPGCDVGPL
jgi:hypothetical protein